MSQQIAVYRTTASASVTPKRSKGTKTKSSSPSGKKVKAEQSSTVKQNSMQVSPKFKEKKTVAASVIQKQKARVNIESAASVLTQDSIELEHLRTIVGEIKREKTVVENIISDNKMLKEQLKRAEQRAKDLDALRIELENGREEQIRYTNQLESTCTCTKALNDSLQNELEAIKAEMGKVLTEKEQLQMELLTASEYIVNLEEKCFSANQTSLDLLSTVQTLEEEVTSLKNHIMQPPKLLSHRYSSGSAATAAVVYTALKSDPVDVKLAEYINNNPGVYSSSQKIKMVRESPGVYDFGSRHVYLKLQQDKILVKVGGGNLPIEQFLEQYTQIELEKLERKELQSHLQSKLAQTQHVGIVYSDNVDKTSSKKHKGERNTSRLRSQKDQVSDLYWQAPVTPKESKEASTIPMKHQFVPNRTKSASQTNLRKQTTGQKEKKQRSHLKSNSVINGQFGSSLKLQNLTARLEEHPYEDNFDKRNTQNIYVTMSTGQSHKKDTTPKEMQGLLPKHQPLTLLMNEETEFQQIAEDMKLLDEHAIPDRFLQPDQQMQTKPTSREEQNSEDQKFKDFYRVNENEECKVSKNIFLEIQHDERNDASFQEISRTDVELAEVLDIETGVHMIQGRNSLPDHFSFAQKSDDSQLPTVRDAPVPIEASEVPAQELLELSDLVSIDQVALDLEKQINVTEATCKLAIETTLKPLLACQDNVQKLSKNDLVKLKGYGNPPVDVKALCEATFILLGMTKADWPSMQREISKPNFIEKLLQFSKNEKDQLPVARMKKVAEFTKKKPTFTPDNMAKKCLACKVLCEWVICVENYHKAFEQNKDKLAKIVKDREMLKTLAEQQI